MKTLSCFLTSSPAINRASFHCAVLMDDEFIYSEQEVIVAPGQIKAPIAVAVAEEAPEP